MAFASADLASVPPSRPPIEGFAEALVHALRRYGAPAHRLELAMQAFSAEMGIKSEFHVLPTSILAATESGGARVLSSEVVSLDVDKLCTVDEIARAVGRGELSPEAGREALRGLAAEPTQGSALADALTWAAASGSAALLFGGAGAEAATAGAVGAAICLLARTGALERNGLVEVVGGVVAGLAARAVPGVAAEATLLGGLVGLYPGLTLTTGMTDLATRHYLSGAGGLLAAAVTLLQLGFGVALGTRLAAPWAAPPVSPAAADPGGAALVGLVLGAFAFSGFLRARREHVPQIFAACLVALLGDVWGGRVFGPSLGGGFAAFLLTAFSNGLSRALDRPAAVTQVPGFWWLVPGSLGFRAVQALLVQDVQRGVEAGFATALSAIALVAGTLFANAVVPPRRTL